MPTWLRRTWHRFALTVVWAVAVFLLVQWVVATLYIYRSDEGGSMEPTMPTSALALGVQTTGPFEKGDVITFRREDGHPVTHTFIGYNPDDTLMTKGEANAYPDRYDTNEEDVIGRVIRHNDARGLWAVVVECLIWLSVASIIFLVAWPLRLIWRSPNPKGRFFNQPRVATYYGVERCSA